MRKERESEKEREREGGRVGGVRERGRRRKRRWKRKEIGSEKDELRGRKEKGAEKARGEVKISNGESLKLHTGNKTHPD